jgi:ribosome-binding factor A
MTWLDLSGGEDLSRSFEPCLKLIIGQMEGQGYQDEFVKTHLIIALPGQKGKRKKYGANAPQLRGIFLHIWPLQAEGNRCMPNPHRQEKLGELIAIELSDLLRTRVKDPRVGFASVTHVEVSGDLRHAKIFVSVLGTEEEQAATIQALKHATGFLRHELAGRIVLRYMPELVFKLDTSIEQGARILELIRQFENEQTVNGGTDE